MGTVLEGWQLNAKSGGGGGGSGGQRSIAEGKVRRLFHIQELAHGNL